MTVRAKTSFATPRRIVHKGDLLDDADPIIEGRSELFEPIGDTPPASSPPPTRAAVKKAKAKKAAAKKTAGDG